MANCQFKTIRENTLKSNSVRETHARKIQLNRMGGKPGIKNIKSAQFKSMPDLSNIAPKRSIQEIEKTDNPEEDSEDSQNKIKKEAKKVKKLKEKLDKSIIKSNVNCNLEQTYNPPVQAPLEKKNPDKM
jgi:hypothetical protein